ncbi:hypothetical protein [Microbacterium sp. CIAB417]|uniref:hypothetical protein n=1 Tax=Microbacterium sp. CIAB417 TaxID=2860287 RepID=UPI001FAE67B6|nr:hypothetical protein [Microbacterium sp. CIAB417]
MTNPTSPEPNYTPPAPATGQPAPAASGYPVYPDPAAAPAPVPGRGLAITGFVLAFVLPFIGLIISIIATVKLGKAGAPKGLSIAGIIIGAILTVVGIIVGIALITLFAGIFATCAELGPGVWDVGGVTYTCG